MIRSKDANGNVKYIARSKAVVLDNRDPLQKGRIIVDHPLLGQTVWIEYLRTPGYFSVPSVGDLVYVECDSGTHEFPVAWGNATKGKDDNPEIPSKFKRDVPTNRGHYTPGGHYIETDDGEAKAGSDPSYKELSTKNRGIRITSSQNNKIHIIEDDDGGTQYILIEDKEGSFIKLDYKSKELTISSVGTSTVNTTQDKTETVGGALSITVTGDATIHSDANINITAATKITVASDSDVSIEGAANVEVKADAMATFKGSSMTTVGDAGAPTMVNGQQVIVAGGGPGVARLGDRAIGIGNLGLPVSSTIIQGSTKVLSG